LPFSLILRHLLPSVAMHGSDPSLPPAESAARAAAQRESLLPGTRLGDFEIVRTLGIGGFGTVYLARDRQLERDVAIKEYLPAALAYRAEGLRVDVRAPHMAAAYAAGLRSFVNEAKILARFNHPAVVKVHRFWEANGTAYMVMPWVQGPTLREVRRAMKAPPTEAWLRRMLDPLLDALALLHVQGIYHRDIAPDNILLPTPDEPVLLDFGAARHVIGERTETITAVLKPSFAPIEQYAEASQLRQGPWTDLYALGAVVVYMLTAVPPAPSTVRSVQDELPLPADGPPPGVSPEFIAAIRWSLAVRPQDRPQSVQALREALDGLVSPPAPRDHGLRVVGTSGIPTAPLWLVDPPIPAGDPPRRQIPASVPGPADMAALAEAAAFAAPPGIDVAGATPLPGWDPTIRLTRPPAWPVLATPLIQPRHAPSRRVLVAAGVCACALVGGTVLMLARGPVEPTVSTWRALGQQAIERVDARVVEEVIEGPRVPAPPRPVTLAPELPAQPPVLRAVVATSNADEARPPERGGAALARVSMSGTSHAKGADKRGTGVASRKGASGPRNRTATAATPRTDSGPREACGDRGFFGTAICINRQCESPRFMQHPHCVELRRQWQERRLRGERQ
jgi:serine/threonine protein kinase